MKNLPADILKDFPSLHAMGTRAYLDSAASSLTPTPVVEAMDAYYKECRANVHRGMYRTSGEASERYEQARAKVAKFLNAETEEIVFTRGATESLNLLAYTLCQGLQSGDEIVTTEMEHHANLVPWQQLSATRGAVLKFIPVKPDFTLDMDAARALIGPKTKIVTVVHASNVLGTVNPVREIAALAHAAGAVCVVDAAQSVGHRRIDVREIGCDFLAFSGHKMLGPTGIGVLYGRKDLLETLPPFQFGGDMIREVSLEKSTWNDVPWKFEAGTPNVSGAIGLGAAVDYIESVGLDAIEAHERALTAYAITKISAIPGVRVIGPTEGERVGAVAFDIPGMHPHDLVTLLDREGVSVRGGHHCAMPLHEKLGLPGTGRASLHLYNDEKDVDLLAAALAKAKSVLEL
ncbi:MAG TPA: cysteine desulfurase [Candidatus Baltobacteraceae bacterium]|nr:cysteine desulfurase [Candidatus Baltobacteraceae bacterium]